MLSGKELEEATALQHPHMVSFSALHRFPFSLALAAHRAALGGGARMGTSVFVRSAQNMSLHSLSLPTTSRLISTACIPHLLRRRHRLLRLSECIQWVWMCVMCSGSVSSTSSLIPSTSCRVLRMCCFLSVYSISGEHQRPLPPDHSPPTLFLSRSGAACAFYLSILFTPVSDDQ